MQFYKLQSKIISSLLLLLLFVCLCVCFFYAVQYDLSFKKAFNSITQKFLESLVSFGIPKKIDRLVKLTLEGAQARVIVDG
jgi:phage-related holin